MLSESSAGPAVIDTLTVGIPSGVTPREVRRLEIGQHPLADGFRTGPGFPARVRFELGQVVFGLGVGPHASLRAWYRRFEWEELRRRRGMLFVLAAIARSPLRMVRDAWRVLQLCGAPCRDRHGIPLAGQFAHLVWLQLRHGIEPESYYRFWLYHPDRRRRAPLYLLQQPAAVFYRVLAEREALSDFVTIVNKSRFDRWCREHDLPIARVFAELRDGELESPLGADAPSTAAGRDLFSKPIDENGGRGARRWTWREDGWEDDAGRPHDWDALVATLREQSRGSAVLLQERLGNDSRLAPVSGAALCTVRFVTARAPGGQPEIVHAVFRTGVGASATDNFSGGGVAVAVDLESGRLGSAIKKDKQLFIAPVDAHPDTGQVFAGFQLPWWPEARALAVRAHALMSDIGFVGWDVALSPTGPVLVEGNFSPGRFLAQVPSGIAAGETNHMRYIDAHLRRTYAAHPLGRAGSAR